MFLSKSISTTSGKSSAQISEFQTRLITEGQEIINVRFARKIAELDELIMKPEYAASRKTEVRQITEDTLKNYFDETKRIEKKQAAGARVNPLLALLGGAGGLSAGPDDEEEEEYEPEEEDSVQLPKKLLLDKIALDNSNKVNLKFSLELETPQTSEAKKRSAEEGEKSEPKAKKQKQEKKEEAKEKEETKADEKKQEEKEDEEEELPIISSNKLNNELANMLRGQIDEVVDWCTTIRAWLQSNISRNKNIGGADLKGEIQNEMMAEIQTVEQELLNHKEVIAAYYVARAGILEKYTKAPEFEDYKIFVVDEDEKQWIALRAILIQMRNSIMTLYDAILKDSDELFSGDSGSKNDSFGFSNMY